MCSFNHIFPNVASNRFKNKYLRLQSKGNNFLISPSGLIFALSLMFGPVYLVFTAIICGIKAEIILFLLETSDVITVNGVGVIFTRLMYRSSGITLASIDGKIWITPEISRVDENPNPYCTLSYFLCATM